MSVEVLEPLAAQNSGDGARIFAVPETTFDDDTGIRRLEDGGSLVGEAYFGSRSILRLVELRNTAVDTTTAVRLRRLLGDVSASFILAHDQAEDLAWQN